MAPISPQTITGTVRHGVAAVVLGAVKGAPQVALEDEQSKETEKRKLLRWCVLERIVPNYCWCGLEADPSI